MTTSNSDAKDTPVKSTVAAKADQAAAKAAATVEEVSTPRHTRRRRKLRKVERGMSKALHKWADSVAKGVKRYDELSEKSAGKKKDGAVRDYGKNLAKAFKVGNKASKKAPRSFLKAFEKGSKLKKKYRKPAEKGVAAFARLLGL